VSRYILVENGIAISRLQIISWCLGKNPSKIDDDCLLALADAFQALGTAVSSKTLVLNCSRITLNQTTNLGWVSLCKSLPSGFGLALYNCDLSLRSEIEVMVKGKFENSTGSRSILYLSDVCSGEFIIDPAGIEAAEETYLRSKVKSCFVDFSAYDKSSRIEVKKGMGRLRSTKIWASGYFDATSLLGNAEIFPWITSKLTDQIEFIFSQIVEGERDFDPVIRMLACTRNGAVLAAASRRLLPDVDTVFLDVVERFAPAHAPIEYYDGSSGVRQSFHNAQQPFERYIYVGDFVIGGTELKLARLHGLYRGIPVEGAVVIGNVADVDSLTDENVSETLTPTSNNQGPVISLFSLTEVCPELKYRFPNV